MTAPAQPTTHHFDSGAAVTVADEHLRATRSVDVSAPESEAHPLPVDLIKEIAMDIGKDIAAHIEVMYPEAVKATSSTFLLSVRNHAYNEIMEAIRHNDPQKIRARLERNRKFRREWKASYKKLRAGK